MHRAGLGELHEFEQRAACFDGDPVIATKKGLNVLERGGQVARHGEMQELLDFPRGEERIERHVGAEEPTFQLHAVEDLFTERIRERAPAARFGGTRGLHRLRGMPRPRPTSWNGSASTRSPA